jgi:hypothetical protein
MNLFIAKTKNTSKAVNKKNWIIIGHSIFNKTQVIHKYCREKELFGRGANYF